MRLCVCVCFIYYIIRGRALWEIRFALDRCSVYEIVRTNNGHIVAARTPMAQQTKTYVQKKDTCAPSRVTGLHFVGGGSDSGGRPVGRQGSGSDGIELDDSMRGDTR